MTDNRIRPADDVRVELDFGGQKLDAFQGSGFHTVDEAVHAAFHASRRPDLNIQDYVYKVTNLTTGTSARYRLNAGGHLRILPEERA